MIRRTNHAVTFLRVAAPLSELCLHGATKFGHAQLGVTSFCSRFFLELDDITNGRLRPYSQEWTLFWTSFSRVRGKADQARLASYSSVQYLLSQSCSREAGQLSSLCCLAMRLTGLPTERGCTEMARLDLARTRMPGDGLCDTSPACGDIPVAEPRER